MTDNILGENVTMRKLTEKDIHTLTQYYNTTIFKAYLEKMKQFNDVFGIETKMENLQKAAKQHYNNIFGNNTLYGYPNIPHNLSSPKERIKYTSKNKYGREEFGIFINRQFIGASGIQLIGKKTMNIGYQIGAEFHETGYEFDFLKTMIKYAFEKYKIERLYLEFFVSGYSSLSKTLENLGFYHIDQGRRPIVYEGTLYSLLENIEILLYHKRFRLSYLFEVLAAERVTYELLRSEWEKK